MALEGMRLIHQYLPRACSNGKDIEARAQMLAAASMGRHRGSRRVWAACMRLRIPVGSWFNTHHGLTNAIILPYVVLFNRKAIEEKTEIIARVLNLPAKGFDGFLAWLLEWRRELEIPHSLGEIGVNIDNSAIIGHEASIDPSAGGNPLPVTAAHLEHIFRAAVHGKLDSIEPHP